MGTFLKSFDNVVWIKKGEASDLAVKFCFRNLILCGGGFSHHIHAAAAEIELDLAVGEREERPVAAGADVLAGDEFAAALADDDATGADKSAAKFFYAEPFADAVAAVPYAALTFFMCHKILSVDGGDLHHG